MVKLNTIILDDEPIASKGLAEEVSQIDFINLIATAASAAEARQLIDIHHPDLMFLDIQIPRLTGFQFLQSLIDPPMVIAVTAHPQFAIEGYRLDVLDYLLKPVSFNLLLRACTKALEYHRLKNIQPGNPEDVPEYIFIKSDNRYDKIFLDDILFVEGADNYIFIHTKSKKYIAYLTFKSIEESLPKTQFIKVHKSFIAAINKINSIEGNLIIIGDKQIPVSRTLKDEVLNVIVNNRLLKR